MNKIRLSKSVVGEREKEALSKVIDEGYLGMGGFVREFEEKLGEYIGANHVVCLNSGTAALHIALMSLGLNPGDEVLVQSLTFVASYQAITASGLIPVSCEVSPKNVAIDLADAEKKITKKTRAIMPVHYASRTGDLDKIYDFAIKHKLRVVEDAAHAFGSLYKGKKIGSFGDVACFSFDGIKNITSGEGGAIVTSDDKVAEYAKDARLLGVKRDTEKRYSGGRSWEFDVAHQGYRYHMSNLNAAIGIVQLDRFAAEFKPARQRLAKKYHEALSGLSGLSLFPDDYDIIVPHIFPITVKDGMRDNLRKYLLERQIECGVHYYPNHRLAFFNPSGLKLPVTDKIYSELLTLPLHPDLTDEDMERVVGSVRGFFDGEK